MPPISDVVYGSSTEAGFDVGATWFAVFVLVVVAVTLLVAVSICGCGGKKKKEDGGGGGAGADGGAVEKPKTDEKSAKAEEKKADGGGKAAAAGADGAGGSGEKQGGANPDMPRPGVPAEEKKRTAPPIKGIDEGNPAYQTLVNQSKFEASQAQTKGLPPPPVVPVPSSKLSKMSTVAGTNPAYQTLVNTSKFEASQAAKTGGGTVMKTAVGTTQMKTTAM